MQQSRIRWPNDARVAVAITFDPDFETVWFFNPENLENEKTLSLGRYGLRRGIQRVFELLEQERIPATFFTLGYTAENYPDAIREMAKRGEVAAHGLRHENLGKLNETDARALIREMKTKIERVVGKKVVGMRAHGDYRKWIFKVLEEAGFEYDSSMKDDDRPYKMIIDGRTSDFIQIPFHWINDDFPFFGFEKNQIPVGTAKLISPYQALETWKLEFDGYHREGGLSYCIALHPQVSGTPGRILLLRDLIAYMKSKGDVWFATMSEIATYYREHVEKMGGG